MQKWQTELYSSPSWLVQTLLSWSLAASVVILFFARNTRFGREFSYILRLCLTPKSTVKVFAADYGDDYAAVNRSTAECVEYLYVQRALRLDAGFECLRVLDVCSDECRRGVDTGV